MTRFTRPKPCASRSRMPRYRAICAPRIILVPARVRSSLSPVAVGDAGAARGRRPMTRLRKLEQGRAALAAADAHGDDAVAVLAALHLVGDGADQARAGHA